jgi:fucose 4-O-acetylase-like acetyltransferase
LFGAFLRKRFRETLQPYLFTILLIYIISVSFTDMSIRTALGRFAKSMYATGEYIEWIQLWFLPGLFISSLFAYLLYRIVLMRFGNRYLRWLVLLALPAAGVLSIGAFYPFSVAVFGKAYELYGLPYSLDIVLISGFFYILGSEVRRLPLDKVFDNKWFLLLSGGGLFALSAIFNQRADLAARIFESFPINTMEALLGIAFTLALSKQIASTSTRFASALAYIGQASLFILIFHVPVQEFWATKIFLITDQQAFSILSAYVVSIIICLGIYKIFFEKNPIALFWFGRKSSPPVKQETTAEFARNIEEERVQKYGEL